ncbi:FxsA family protein [Actinoplanes sp. GCM10030250]|uniref:FxsA family protein n=1 Tax=Actinoplanes sp. GCM10030250 TaxID=3273376 RepID=UPI003608D837
MRRSRLAYLPIAFPLLAFAEIMTFLLVAHAIGTGWAVLILVVATLAGFALLRREGIRGWHAFQDAANAGRPPGTEVSSSLIGLAGALLLAIPGYITGVLGLLLLLPPGRTLARRGVERFAQRNLGSAVTGNLFGPRRVKVHPGAPVTVVVPDDDPRPPAAAIEGEIIR